MNYLLCKWLTYYAIFELTGANLLLSRNQKALYPISMLQDNGESVKVYLIQSKRYAFRLNFKRAIRPEWVLDALNNINLSTTIGFEDGEMETVAELETIEQLTEAIEAIELIDDVEFIGGPDYATVVHQSIDSIEEVWKQEIKQDIKQENYRRRG